MKEQLKQAFPQCKTNDCLSFHDLQKLWVIDPDEKVKCEIVTVQSDQCDFEVLNPSGVLIGFIAVDQCLFDDSKGKKCDCILFSEDVFCFVEIKNTKLGNRKAEKRKAYAQLAATITVFQSKINFENIRQEANVCFSMKKANIFPQRSASSLNCSC